MTRRSLFRSMILLALFIQLLSMSALGSTGISPDQTIKQVNMSEVQELDHNRNREIVRIQLRWAALPVDVSLNQAGALQYLQVL